MAPSRRSSAAAIRSARCSETSSTRGWSNSNARWSSAACSTRSVLPSWPSTRRWAPRTRRKRRLRTSNQTSANNAAPAAASATTAGALLNSDTAQRLTLSEQRRVRRLVVRRHQLARHRGHVHRDVQRRVQRRLAIERQRHRHLLALGRARDRLGQRQRRTPAGARDLQRDLDVELVVVALVGERDGERLAGGVDQPVRGTRLQRRIAVGGAVEAGAVLAGTGRRLAVGAAAAVAARARRELLAQLGSDV